MSRFVYIGKGKVDKACRECHYNNYRFCGVDFCAYGKGCIREKGGHVRCLKDLFTNAKKQDAKSLQEKNTVSSIGR